MTIEESCCRLGWQGFPSYFWRRKKESGWSIYDDLPFLLFFFGAQSLAFIPSFLPSVEGTGGKSFGDTHTHTHALSLVQYQASQVVLLQALRQAHAHLHACMCLVSFPLMLFVGVQHGTPGEGGEDKERREERAEG